MQENIQEYLDYNKGNESNIHPFFMSYTPVATKTSQDNPYIPKQEISSENASKSVEEYGFLNDSKTTLPTPQVGVDLPDIIDTSNKTEKPSYTPSTLKFSGSNADFIKKLRPYADSVGKKYGIAPELIIAQSALETGFGKHTPGNMFFGIKAGGNWKGKTQNLGTNEEVNGKMIRTSSTFRAYDSPQESLEDYAQFLLKNSRYKNVLGKTNPYEAAQAIARSGYATDSNYYGKLKGIIDKIRNT